MADQEPDDGFTPEERSQFDQMAKETSGRAHVVEGAEPPAEAVGGADQGGAAPGSIEVPADLLPGADDKPAAAAKVAGADEGGDDDGGDEGGAAGVDIKDKGGRTRRVSRAVYEAEKKRADDLAAKLRERDETSTRLDERMRIINEALTAKPSAAAEKAEDDDPEPNQDEDFIEHGKWVRRQLGKAQEQIRSLGESLAQERHGREIQQTYEGDAIQFARAEPAFVHAYDWLMRGRAAEMAIYFFGKDVTTDQLTAEEQAKIAAEVSAEEKHLVSGALKKGQSPAKLIYSMARARGFDPASVVKPAADAGAAAAAGAAKPNGNGKVPGSLAEAAGVADGDGGKPAANGKGSVTEEIARVKAGVDSGTSLSQGGGAPTRTLTPEMLANMPEEEFGRLLDQLSPAQQRQVMGG